MTQLHPGSKSLSAPASDGDTRQCSWLQVDLPRLQANFNAFRQLLQQNASTPRSAPRLCAVVKKNAYGLGLGPVAKRLAQAGADMLAVYSPDEAEQLMHHAITCPILLLMPLRQLARTDVLYRQAVAGKLHLTVHDPDHLARISEIGRTFGAQIPVHLHLDTGMSRSGLSPDQFRQLIADRSHYRHVQFAGFWSHLATADDDPEFACHQFQQFEHVVEQATGQTRPDGVSCHLANTFASLRDPRFHQDMIRPGLGLLGYGPESLAQGPRIDPAPPLQPVLRWLSRLTHIQHYPAGAPVGYGSTHRLQRDSLLGVVSVGYGDGYPLALSNKGVVRVEHPQQEDTWLQAPVLGRINMDQIVVDLTDLVDADPAQWLHTHVELVSNDPAAPNALHRLADLAGSHCYEMLCRLAAHVPRRYIR